MCRIRCLDETDSVPHYHECLHFTFYLHPSVDSPLCSQGETIFSMTLSSRCSCEASNMNLVMGLIDAFVYAHHKQRGNTENPGDVGSLLLCSRIPGNLPDNVHTRRTAKARYRHLFHVRTTTRGVLALLMVCRPTIPQWNHGYCVRSCHHYRSSSCIRTCQN